MRREVAQTSSLLLGFGPISDPLGNHGNLAAKERRDRKEQALYCYAFSAFFRG
jgi:hypothetical protein